MVFRVVVTRTKRRSSRVCRTSQDAASSADPTTTIVSPNHAKESIVPIAGEEIRVVELKEAPFQQKKQQQQQQQQESEIKSNDTGMVQSMGKKLIRRKRKLSTNEESSVEENPKKKKIVKRKVNNTNRNTTKKLSKEEQKQTRINEMDHLSTEDQQDLLEQRSQDDIDNQHQDDTSDSEISSRDLIKRMPTKQKREPKNAKSVPKKASRKKVKKKRKDMLGKRENRFGPAKDRACPYCNKVFSIVLGLAYHLEHKVCQKKAVVDLTKDRTNDTQTSLNPFHILSPGDQFVTTFGVVQVVADNRASPSDHQSAEDLLLPSKTDNVNKQKRIERKIRSTLRHAAMFQHLRRKKLSQIYSDKTIAETPQFREEIWKLYCPLAAPSEILSGIWSWGSYQRSLKGDCTQSKLADPQLTQNENADPPVNCDSFPDRIVECILIKDERRKVTDVEEELQDDNRISRMEVAKASIAKARKEATVMVQTKTTANTSCHDSDEVRRHESGLKLFIQRRLLTNKYNSNCPLFLCSLCGRSFNSRVGLKGHLVDKICEKKREQFVHDRQTRLIEILENAPKIKPHKQQQQQQQRPPPTEPLYVDKRRIKAHVRQRLPGWIVFHNDRSSMYPEVFEHLNFKRGSNNSRFLQKKWEADGRKKKIRKKKRKTVANEESQTPANTEVVPLLLQESLSGRSSTAVRPRSKKAKRKNIPATVDTESSHGFDDDTSSGMRGKKLESPSNVSMPRLPDPLHLESTHISISSNNDAQKSEPSIQTETKASKKRVRKASASKSITSAPMFQQHSSSNADSNSHLNATDDKDDKAKPPEKSKIINPVKHAAPLLDTSVFVEEIRAGRYPSIKQYEGEHTDVCTLCKDGGELLCCEFCRNAEHVQCVQKRLNVRDLRPEDDFMCHKCIQTILQRRSRAEKRRLEKRDSALGLNSSGKIMTQNSIAIDSTNQSTVSLPSNADDSNLPNETLGETSLVTQETSLVTPETALVSQNASNHVNILRSCPNGGPGGLICCEWCTASYSRMLSVTETAIETQMVSKIGHEVSELMELLNDAQIRLQQAIDASAANDTRRLLL